MSLCYIDLSTEKLKFDLFVFSNYHAVMDKSIVQGYTYGFLVQEWNQLTWSLFPSHDVQVAERACFPQNFKIVYVFFILTMGLLLELFYLLIIYRIVTFS